MYTKTALRSPRSVRGAATIVGFCMAGCATEPVHVQSNGYEGHCPPGTVPAYVSYPGERRFEGCAPLETYRLTIPR
jgi:hypothetical protein